MNYKIKKHNSFSVDLIINNNKYRITDKNKKKKHYDNVWNLIILILFIIVLFYGIKLWHDTFPSCHGYYVPDYIDEDGVLHDIDGDGDYYKYIIE